MDRTQEYRRRAIHCRKMAGSSSTPGVRENYEELAAMWDRLAEERLKFFVTVNEQLRHGSHQDSTPRP